MRRLLLLLVAVGFITGGCGGGNDEAEVTTTTALATTTTKPPFDPTKSETALVPIPGYAYQDLPQTTADQTKAALQSDATLRESIRSVTVRSVTKDGRGVASVFSLGLDPRFAAQPSVAAQFAEEFAGRKSRVQAIVLAGEPAHLARDSSGVTYLLWLKGSLMLVVAGQDRAQLEPVATALVSANR